MSSLSITLNLQNKEHFLLVYVVLGLFNIAEAFLISRKPMFLTKAKTYQSVCQGTLVVSWYD